MDNPECFAWASLMRIEYGEWIHVLSGSRLNSWYSILAMIEYRLTFEWY